MRINTHGNTVDNWVRFLEYIVKNETLPTTKKANEDFGISFAMWFELANRMNRDKDSFVNNARTTLAKMTEFLDGREVCVNEH